MELLRAPISRSIDAARANRSCNHGLAIGLQRLTSEAFWVKFSPASGGGTRRDVAGEGYNCEVVADVFRRQLGHKQCTMTARLCPA
jgi:hypothetical protein